MKRAIPFVPAVLGVFCSGLTASAEPAAVESPPAPEDFAILPWDWTPGKKEILDDIRRCGFNLAGFVKPEHVDAVASAGLKCIVFDRSLHVDDAAAGLEDAEIARRVKAVVDRVAGKPAVFGYYLRDEPGAAAYSGLARWSEAVRKAAPKAFPYINLFPNYASAAQMGVPTYDEYVESFLTVVKPPYLSYDHYALMEDGSLRDGYFQNLETVRAAALRHKVPFWNIVLANAHYSYAEPTEAGLRFQAYTTLAYGARGISYFTYFTPSGENYRLAPIDPFGDKTATWHFLRRVNLQIHRLAPTYIRLRSVHVFHHPEVPRGCAPVTTSRFLDQVAGGNLLVGEFEDPEGRPWVLIVNKSLTRSTPYSVKFKSPGRLVQASAFTGTVNAGSETNWLAPGQGMLLGLQKPR